MLLKIGELAKRTGLTVRSLHHYDAIGLLRPSARSEAGYRLYNRDDIARLHRIQALRRMNLALAEVAALLDNDGAGLQEVIEQQIALLDRQASRAMELRDRLKLLLTRLNQNVEPDLPDWLITLEMMAMYDKYFTSDEVAALRLIKAQETKAMSSEKIALIARIRNLMDRKISPDSNDAQALAIPWMSLAHQRMGGDARLIRKLDALHRNEPIAQMLTGVDGAMIDYMAQASVAFHITIYQKYLGAECIQPLRARFGDYRMKWLELASELTEHMAQGIGPDSAEGQDLCARWLALSIEVWGTDPEVHRKIADAHRNEPDLLVGTGINQNMIAFLERGIAALLAQRQTSKTEAIHA